MSKESKNCRIVNSTTYDPWSNLALEEYMLNNLNEGEIILYLWQNQNTVVIGRNQNAWKECRCKLLEDEEGKLARRLSGGGAVFHDLGNLNFTFITDKELYNLEKQLEVILHAAKKMGIDAEFSGRNDLIVNGKKFSGNAFYYGSKSSYHHGTVLVDTDFNKLLRYLQVSKEKIQSKGVDSVRARVVNLKELNSELTMENIKPAMQGSFIELYGDISRNKDIDPSIDERIKEELGKYSSWEWRYGQTPDFDLDFDHRFDWGGIEIGLNLQKGHIKKATVYSDAMDVKLIQDIADVLEDIPLEINSIIDNINKLKTNEEGKKHLKELNNWLKTREL